MKQPNETIKDAHIYKKLDKIDSMPIHLQNFISVARIQPMISLSDNPAERN
jgi:hypothetical protein